MPATFQSSGDLIADRRFEWARETAARGDFAAAADLLGQVLALAPDYAAAWFALGEVREKCGERDGAIGAFNKARALDPADRQGAALHLTRLGAQPLAEMPPGYVAAVFDEYAQNFDRTLTRRLHYKAPQLILDAMYATGAARFGSVLDLGCGTGLAGEKFRAITDWLVGVDLSGGMLAQARQKGLYDRLHQADILAFLAAEAAIGATYTGVISADVAVYMPDLAGLTALVGEVLPGNGRFAFSVETHAGDDVILRDTLRFAHGEAHVRAALAAAGLEIVSLDSAATRTEKGEPVPGLIVVAAKA